MSLDNSLWLGYIGTEAVVVSLLIYRRAWRILPIFCIYCALDVISNLTSFASSSFFRQSPGSYLLTYLIQTIVDSVLQFCVLVELAWSVLRPVRSVLPRSTLPALVLLLLAVGAVIWLIPTPSDPTRQVFRIQLVMHLQQCVAILRILFFLLLAGCSQLLSIGWRDRELQVATGMGLYSICSLAITMLQVHLSNNVGQYAHLNQFVVASFLCCLFYWVFSFAQKEPERREFTPQMQNLLLAVAGVARAERTALAEASKQKHQ